MARDILIGLDLGSTSFKAVAASLGGDELAVSSVATPWERTTLGTTMSPAYALNAAEGALRKCIDQIADARVISAGITGMAEAGFLIDDVGTEAAPAHAWFDERGLAEAKQLAADLTSNWFSVTTGLPVAARCSAVKLKHIARSNPSLRGRRWESLPEWMARRLGAEHRAELSLAARTGLLDIHSRDWSAEMLNWVDLDPTDMPRPKQAGEVWGRADEGTVVAGAMLTVAGHDHVCAAIGAGAQDSSDVLNSLGTGEAVLCSSGSLDTATTLQAVEADLTVGIHVVPDRHLLMAGLGTGGRLSKVLALLGVSSSDTLELFEASLPDSMPSNDVEGWAAEIVRDGAARSTIPEKCDDPAAEWQSAVAAAGNRLDDAICRLERFSGKHDRVLATGGWFRSAAFRRLRRQTVRRSLHVPEVSEATGLGAALMAGVAAGIYSNPLTVPRPRAEEL